MPKSRQNPTQHGDNVTIRCLVMICVMSDPDSFLARTSNLLRNDSCRHRNSISINVLRRFSENSFLARIRRQGPLTHGETNCYKPSIFMDLRQEYSFHSHCLFGSKSNCPNYSTW